MDIVNLMIFWATKLVGNSLDIIEVKYLEKRRTSKIIMSKKTKIGVKIIVLGVTESDIHHDDQVELSLRRHG